VRKFVVTLGLGGLVVGLGAFPAAAGSGNLKKFCKTNIAVDKAFSAEEPNLNKINDLLDTAIDAAPPDIADAVETAATAIQEDPQTAFEDPVVGEAVSQIDQFVLDECGYEVVSVTMADYSFTGIPEELEKGTAAFNVTNEGAEAHVVVVFRFKGDETLDEILELSEEEAEERVTIVGEAYADPGDSNIGFIPLKKTGRYAAICPIPVGSTPEAGDEGGSGPPHFVEGMATEFEVTN
jgi:hypothetical protein